VAGNDACGVYRQWKLMAGVGEVELLYRNEEGWVV